jgi:hypothetical protein
VGSLEAGSDEKYVTGGKMPEKPRARCDPNDATRSRTCSRVKSRFHIVGRYWEYASAGRSRTMEPSSWNPKVSLAFGGWGGGWGVWWV